MRKPRSSDAICNAAKPQLAVSYLPLAALAPAERNARTHSQAQIAQLVASISAFGWTNPILIDEDRAIIAGHGRLEAAKAAGLSTSAGSAAGLPSRKTPAKHRYLLPLDAEMRDRIAPLSQPYPRRVKQATDGRPPFSGGAAPTHTLQPTRGLVDAA